MNDNEINDKRLEKDFDQYPFQIQNQQLKKNY